eukprot:1342114-Pleurochrysis_carterae.AAC.1
MERVYAASGGPLAPSRTLASRRGIYEDGRLHRKWHIRVERGSRPLHRLAIRHGGRPPRNPNGA